jgi:hypothetical protein
MQACLMVNVTTTLLIGYLPSIHPKKLEYDRLFKIVFGTALTHLTAQFMDDTAIGFPL